MPLFLFDIGAKAAAVARFILRVRSELQRVVAAEKISQQAIAQKLEVNRSVINRRLLGFENLTVRTVAEIAWSLGWEPYFELRKKAAPEATSNYFVTSDADPKQLGPTVTSNKADFRAA